MRVQNNAYTPNYVFSLSVYLNGFDAHLLGMKMYSYKANSTTYRSTALH
jgi:hypothetical protein